MDPTSALYAQSSERTRMKRAVSPDWTEIEKQSPLPVNIAQVSGSSSDVVVTAGFVAPRVEAADAAVPVQGVRLTMNYHMAEGLATALRKCIDAKD